MSVLNYPTAHSLCTLFTAVVTATEITASTRHFIHVTILLSLRYTTELRRGIVYVCSATGLRGTGLYVCARRDD